MKKITLILWILFAFPTQKISAQNAPVTRIPDIIAIPNTIISIPVKVTDFNNIGALSLTLNYTCSGLNFQSSTNDSGFPGLVINGTIPGVILAGGFVPTGETGMTLSDNAVLFTLYFSYLGGSVDLNWSDNGPSCEYTDYPPYNTLNDLPGSTYYIGGSVKGNAPLTIAPLITSSPGSGVSVPVKVNSFNTIGAVSLTLKYDPDVLTYLSAENTSAFPGLSINSPEAGTVIIGGYSSTVDGITYDDNTTLFTLNFTYLGGTTGLNWFDDGGSCEYAGPLGNPVLDDSPRPNYYQDGSVSPPREFNLKAFLEGPFNTVSGFMNTTLNTSTLIPVEQPYNTAPWNYAGAEEVDAVPAGVVDWVLIEFRDASTSCAALPATILAGWPKAFFLKSDGSIVALDGTSPPDIGNSTILHNLFVIVRHRNHIGVMSAGSMTLAGDSYSYDFSTNAAQAYGNNMKLTGGVYAIYGGDSSHDGIVDGSDMSDVYNASKPPALMGYNNQDVNWDGIVDGADMSMIYNNSRPPAVQVQIP